MRRLTVLKGKNLTQSNGCAYNARTMQTRLYIGGQWLEADATLEVVNPATQGV
ncbi:MAG: hypothetical protein HC933_21835, partial [Pleurocapsa sp. SU_196_0]|nr:hypothetical protein [Pleurocapsa sp. SU_196_0]